MTSREQTLPADAVKLLEQLPVFYDFTHEELKKVAAIAQETHFEPRQTVYRSGDRGDRVFLVVSGLVRMAGRDDDETTPDDFIIRSRGLFGEDCACDDSTRGMSAMALMRTHCLTLTRDGLLRLEEQHPRVALKLLRKFARTTSQRLRQAVAKTPGRADAPLAPVAHLPAERPVERQAVPIRAFSPLERVLATLSTVRKPKAV